MTNIQGRYSVDFRFNPSQKNISRVRNTVSSQSNSKKGFNNPKSKSISLKTSKKKRIQTDQLCLCKSTPLKDLFSTVIKL
jgi:hypothetical protein